MSIGVIDLPIDDIICGTGNGLPAVTKTDWQDIRVIRMSMSTPNMGSNINAAEGDRQRMMVVDVSRTLRLVKQLSFYGFLRDTMFSRAREYADKGVREMMVSNKCMLNFGALNPEPAVYWLFRSLLNELAGDMNDFKFGVEIREGCSMWSINIACHAGISFAVVDFNSRSEIAMLTARANMMTAGKTRPKLIVRMPNDRLDEGSGFDGIMLEQIVNRTPLVRPAVWQCLDDGLSRVIEPGSPL